MRKALVPCVAEHRPHNLKKVRRGLHRGQQGFEVAFDPLPRNRLAVIGAALRETEVVRIAALAAFRPCSGQRLFAAGAEDRAAQGEVRRYVLARRGASALLEALPNALIGGKAHQPLMVALAEGDVPVRHLDHSRIDGADQNVGHALGADFIVGQVLGKFGLAFEEAFDFGLCFEAARSEAFESVLHDGSERLIAYKDFAEARRAFVLVSYRRLEAPIAVHHPRPHPVHRLLRIFLALVLRDGGQQILNQQRVGIFPKLNGGALKVSPGIGNRRPQLQMRFESPRQTRYVINNDDEPVLAVLAEELEHGDHAGARGQTARHIVAENLHGVIALHPRIFAAARFLRSETVAALGLRCAGHPRINHSLLLIRFLFHQSFHDSFSPAAFKTTASPSMICAE